VDTVVDNVFRHEQADLRHRHGILLGYAPPISSLVPSVARTATPRNRCSKGIDDQELDGAVVVSAPH
jgi:hypothetical protein